jgi:diaminopimelate decarboxylase
MAQMASSRPAFFTVADDVLRALADRYGTPLLVLDEETLKAKVADWQRAVAHQPYPVRTFYASKALTLVGAIRLLHAGGFGVEAVSTGEYRAARRAGVPPEGILYQGSPKVPDEARAILAEGVRAVVIDSPFEVPVLDALAPEPVDVLVRLNPRWDAHTHAYLATAGEDSKFGVLPGPELEGVLAALQAAKKLRLVGFHVHVGSELRHEEDFDGAYRAFAEMVAMAGLRSPILDVGGGLGVRYEDEETLDPEAFLDIVARRLGALGPAEVWTEPGRSMVSEAGLLLYRLLGVKEREGFAFAFVDGGMGDNIRPALYGARYPLRVVGADGTLRPRHYRVVGRYCESGDVLREDVVLPELSAGDLIAVGTAGAYTYAMSSHYNGVGRPAVVLLHRDGTTTLWARRESPEDLLSHDCG